MPLAEESRGNRRELEHFAYHLHMNGGGRGLYAQACPVIGCRKCRPPSIRPLIGCIGALLTGPNVCLRARRPSNCSQP